MSASNAASAIQPRVLLQVPKPTSVDQIPLGSSAQAVALTVPFVWDAAPNGSPQYP
jgi:hypothetical protein